MRKVKPPIIVWTLAHNIVTHLSGAIEEDQGNTSEPEILNVFINNNIIRIITHCENTYIEPIRNKFQRYRDVRLTTFFEIRAFIGRL